MGTAAEVSTEELAAKFEEDSDIETELLEQAGDEMAAQTVQPAQASQLAEQAHTEQPWSEEDCTESEDDEDLAELEEGQQVVGGGMLQLVTSFSLS